MDSIKKGKKYISQFFRSDDLPRKVGQLLIDLSLIAGALYISLFLRFETTWNPYFDNSFSHIWSILSIYAFALWFSGIYETLWRYAGIHELIRLVEVCIIAAVATLHLNRVITWGTSRAVLFMTAALAVALIGGVRILWRLTSERKKKNEALSQQVPNSASRLMIVGAGMAGAYVLGLTQTDPSWGKPILFVDDDVKKQGRRIQGIPVAGSTYDIPELALMHQIQDIIVAVPGVKGEALTRILNLCRQTSCRIKISSKIQGPDDDSTSSKLYVRDLNISDFLSREEIKLDIAGISEYLSGRTVLVTGGGGSIGSELCRQVIRFKPKRLVIFDIYENTAYELLCELKQQYGSDCPLDIIIGSVRDTERLNEVFNRVKPQIVFHAAAHKHVPLMEANPTEAVKNNVFGTINTLEAASAAGAERFVLLSTDKAVNPTNVMGATKRITELVIQHYAKITPMRCMAVRFGNVLGSHGSVIPIFEQQIRVGGPVTVTHPDIIRYFMTIPEAAQLVLQAGAMAKTGALYVLDMGQPVRIYDLAEQLIRFYGYEPNVNMAINITGLRPGEKLYEELLTPDERERMQRTDHDRIMIAQPSSNESDELFTAQLEALLTATSQSNGEICDVIKAMVPEFSHSPRVA